MEKATCFSQAEDWSGPIYGLWQQESEPRKSPYADVFVGEVGSEGAINLAKANEWKGKACKLQETSSSCFYHGDKRATELAQRNFQASDCTLPAFDATDFLQQVAGKTIHFFGDSVTRQHYESLTCHMSQYITEYHVGWQFRNGQSKRNCPFSGNEHCQLPMKGTCVELQKDTKICFHEEDRAKGLIEDLSKPWVQKSGHVFVLNTGAHYFNNTEGYQRDVEALAKIMSDLKAKGKQVIWRETSPEHFDSASGLYPPADWHKDEAYGCRLRTDAHSNWKNDMANPIIKKAKIPILYVNANARSQWDAHVGNNHRKTFVLDCQHWCLPSVPDLWTRMLYNMLKNYETVKEL